MTTFMRTGATARCELAWPVARAGVRPDGIRSCRGPGVSEAGLRVEIGIGVGHKGKG